MVECVVMWRCERCKRDQVKVRVQERFPDESLEEFMNRAVVKCLASHRKRSPRCQEKRKIDVYVPLGEKLIGDAGVSSPKRLEELRSEFCSVCNLHVDECRCEK